jgi:hypothetical protein
MIQKNQDTFGTNMKIKNTYTLEELASPASPLSSTATISVSISGEKANSFSLPPILYYIGKAKMLSRMGVKNEQEAIQSGSLNFQRTLVDELREIAKSVYRDIRRQNADMENYASAAIQERILSTFFGENISADCEMIKRQAEPINASKSKKNITIPYYLYSRLIELFGSEPAARQQIHNLTYSIKCRLQESNHLDGAGKTTGDAAKTSWSRKVHNELFIELLKMSDIPEIHMNPSVFDVQMVQDKKLETRHR